jgi:hypothetical protein
MKKVFFIILMFALYMAMNGQTQAQCNTALFSQECVGKVMEGYTFLKSFNIDGQGGQKDKIEYSYVFSKNTEYFLNICNENQNQGEEIVLTLYDSTRKKVSSNSIEGKLYPSVIFSCKATGIYYISFTFEKTGNPCGGSVLAFRR